MNKGILKILIHTIGWLCLICIMVSFLQNGSGGSESWFDIIFSLPFLLFITFYVSIFYLNLFVLTPKLILNKNYVAFIIIAIGLLTMVVYIKPFEQLLQATHQFSNMANHVPPNFEGRNMQPPQMQEGDRMLLERREIIGPKTQEQRIDIISLILYFMAMTGSAMIVLSRQWRLTEKNRALVEVQKANAELAFLKAQISPHFLFNVLNNIYALVITKNDNAASSILRLSSIMRYVTDDARADYVAVDREIACINDFIALQRLRLSKSVKVNYSVTGDYGRITVAPLILMAFVENTFKHGVSNNIPSEINIDINVNELGIKLKTQNSIFTKDTTQGRDGVGLQNAIQRLELLYPNNNYQLHTTSENNIFKVVLVLHNAKTK